MNVIAMEACLRPLLAPHRRKRAPEVAALSSTISKTLTRCGSFTGRQRPAFGWYPSNRWERRFRWDGTTLLMVRRIQSGPVDKAKLAAPRHNA
jgi:hypothetical protein